LISSWAAEVMRVHGAGLVAMILADASVEVALASATR
jgi:hypothetical protein